MVFCKTDSVVCLFKEAMYLRYNCNPSSFILRAPSIRDSLEYGQRERHHTIHAARENDLQKNAIASKSYLLLAQNIFFPFQTW